MPATGTALRRIVFIGGTGGGGSPNAFEFIESDSGPGNVALIGGLKVTDAAGPLDKLGDDAIQISGGIPTAANVNKGENAVMIGNSLFIPADADESVVIGFNNADWGGNGLRSIIVGSNNTPGNNNNFIFGDGNSSSDSTDAICIGRVIDQGGNGDGYITIGAFGEINSGSFGIAIGKNSRVDAEFGIAIGGNGSGAGSGCRASALMSISLGARSRSQGVGSIAFGASDGVSGSGAQTGAGAAGSIAFGCADGTDIGPKALAANAMCFGAGLSNDSADTWMHRGTPILPQAADVNRPELLAGSKAVQPLPKFHFAAISAITQANPGVVTLPSGHGFEVGDDPGFEQIAGMVELNGTKQVISAVTATTISIPDTTGNTAYTSDGIVFHKNYRYDFAGSTRFFTDEVHASVRSIDGTLTTQPTISAGDRDEADATGSETLLISAVLSTNLGVVNDTHKDNTLDSNLGITSVSFEIATPPTFNTATLMTIQPRFIGEHQRDE